VSLESEKLGAPIAEVIGDSKRSVRRNQAESVSPIASFDPPIVRPPAPVQKRGFFVLEALNSLCTVYYFYYLYFFMQQVYGFGNRANLMLAALNGGLYAITVWWAGRFAQRFGCFTALKLGFGVMFASMVAGLCVHSALAHIIVMAGNVIGMSFTWPTLEAMTSEGETTAGLQHTVGIYNVVWAATAALANFTGGAMLEKLGFKSLFCVPALIQLTQLGITLWLEAKARQAGAGIPARSPEFGAEGKACDWHPQTAPPLRSPVRAKSFLRMAWLANPFAYIAINTLVAVIPGVARRLELSTMTAGFCCSVWCFSRLGAFWVLWLWDGWHYRFRWLLLGFLALGITFAGIVMAPNVAVLVLAQVVFGGAVGLIYYSSLFYSMDNSQTKSEHGGIHEAAIGVGNFIGPAVGASSLYLAPQHANGGTVAVSVLLLSGLGALLLCWKSGLPKGK